MEIIAINGHRKGSSGKQEAKIRRNDMVPAVMYKSGGGDSATSFSIHPAEFRHLVYTQKFKLVEIALDGRTHKCILKDMQFHPVTESVLHLDFLELTPGVKFKAAVPVRFTGTAPEVKAGGKFLPKMRKVNIVMTPEQIVDEVVADISKMELDETIRIRDIKLPEGVVITNGSSIPIASIEVPRALKSSK